MSDHPAAAAASWRSAHRPWSLIDSKCLIGDRDNATTAHAVTSQRNDIKVTFELADPPGVSRCFVHFPGLAEGRYAGEPVVVSSADAFVLLVVPFTDGSEHKDFIVYRAGPGAPSLRLLPSTYRSPEYFTLAGVVPLVGADLRAQGTRVIFAGRETLGWVNHWHGILLCHVLAYRPVMCFIQWPVSVPRNRVPRFGMGVDNIYARPFRDVAISNGLIRFVELRSRRFSDDTPNEKGVIGNGWTVTTWNRGICSKKWNKRFTVKADNVPLTGSSYPKVSGGKRLSWDKVLHGGTTLSLLCDDDVVYIMARLDIRHPVAWMLAINIIERTLEAVKECSVEKMLGLEPTYVQCTLSNYLNK
ncbi:hypothetical protein ZWY2020_031580 [Hordeum vulgare]|nr:hypothetical protein ZWY2020_031580 [Hordeum vulgare]